MTRRHILALALVCGAACGGASPNATTPGGDPLAPARLYPLAMGNVWSYDIDDGSDLPTLGITRVVSVDGPRFAVSSNRGEPVHYEVREGGIYRVGTGTWLLRAPVRDGAEWPTGSGRVARVVSTSADVETPAGPFQGCVRVEETGGEAARTIRTVYCTDVGPVWVESTMQTEVSGMEAKVVGRLRGYQLATPDTVAAQ